MKKFTLLLFILFAGLSLFGQTASEIITAQVAEDDRIPQLKTALDEWLQQTPEAERKNYKFLARMLWDEVTRVDPQTGEYPSPAVFFQALEDVRRKNQGPLSRSGTAWIPEGPTVMPTSKTPHGPGIGRVNCLEFHPTDTNTLFAGTPDGGIWKTTNHGQTWIPLGDGLPVPGVSDIAVDPNNPDIIYIASGDIEYFSTFLGPRYSGSAGYIMGVGILKSEDGGQSWQTTGLSFNPEGDSTYQFSMLRRVYVNPENSEEVITGGPTGIWKSYDAGQNWSHIDTSLFLELRQHPSLPQVLYAATTERYAGGVQISDEDIYKSEDFGDTWTKLEAFPNGTAISRIAIAAAPSSPDTVYAVGVGFDNGLEGMYRTTDGGASWELTLSGDSLNLLGRNTGDPDTDGGGQGWYDLTIAVDPQDANRLFVGGINQWGSEDGGFTWAPVSTSSLIFGPTPHVDHHQVRYSPYFPHRFYLCSDGGLDYTDDLQLSDLEAILECIPDSGGINNIPPGCYTWPTEWTHISDGLAISQFYKIDVWQGTDSLVLLGGTQDNSHIYYNGSQWFNVFRADGMAAIIHPEDPRIIYGSSQNANLRVSYDGGDNYTGGLDDFPQDSAFAVSTWITPYLMNPVNPDVLYAGFNKIWRSTDGGFNWNVFPAFGFNSRAMREIAIHPADTNAFAAIKDPSINGYVGTALVSQDGGNTFAEVKDGLPLKEAFLSDIAFGNAPTDLYATFASHTAGEKVYSSTDAGENWENISKDLPNIPVLCVMHHHNSLDNTVYIGTDFGVYYTNDNLSEWVPLNDGLPQIRINDLDIHYGFGRLFAGTYGRGIWSTDLIETPTQAEDAPIYEAQLQLYPNPNRGRFQLQIDQAGFTEAQLEIIDITGKRVYSQDLEIPGSRLNLPLELDLPSGLYHLNLMSGKRSRVVKFVIE